MVVKFGRRRTADSPPAPGSSSPGTDRAPESRESRSGESHLLPDLLTIYRRQWGEMVEIQGGK